MRAGYCRSGTIQLTADASSVGVRYGCANPVKIRWRPHVGKCMPGLLLAATVKIRPHNFQHFNLRNPQMVYLLRWQVRHNRQPTIAVPEIAQVLSIQPGSHFLNLAVKMRSELRTYVP